MHSGFSSCSGSRAALDILNLVFLFNSRYFFSALGRTSTFQLVEALAFHPCSNFPSALPDDIHLLWPEQKFQRLAMPVDILVHEFRQCFLDAPPLLKTC